MATTKSNAGDPTFTSTNPYNGLKCLVADDPQKLCDLINSIRVSIKIWFIVAANNQHICYFSGDVKIKNKKGVK